MATIRERRTSRGRKRYFVEIRVKGRPAVRQTFASKTAAKAWATKTEDGLRSGRLDEAIEAERHTLSEAIDRYIEDHLQSLSTERSQRKRRQQLEWWRGRLGSWSLAAITPAAIAEVRREIVKRTSGPTSNRYLAALSAVLKLAAGEWQWISANPVSKIRRAPESQGRVRWLSKAEKEALLAACKESPEARLYPLVVFALHTGARRGELMGLRWKDVDLATMRAALHETKNRSRRALSFPGEAGKILREMARTPSITGYVFAGGKKTPPRFPRKAWTDALAASGVEDFRFHDLRHTAASYLAMSGATLPELAAFLGHRTLDMVQRYAHLSEQHSEGVAARMAEKFL